MVARLLNAGGRGQLTAIITIVTTIGWVGSVGARQAISYELSVRPENSARLFGTWVALIGVLTVIGIVIAELALPPLMAAQSGATIHAAQEFAPALGLMLAAEVFAGFALGHQAFLLGNVLRISPFFVTLLLYGVIYAFGEFDLASVLFVTAEAYAVPTLVGAAWVLRRDGWARPSVALARSNLAYGVRAQFGFVGLLVNSRLDLMVMPAFIRASEIGIYAISSTIASMFMTMGDALSSVMLPAAARRGGAEGARVIWRVVRLTLIVSLGLGLVLAVGASPLIRIVYGDQFHRSAGVLRLLLPGCVVFAAAYVLISGLAAANRPLLGAAAQLVGATVTAIGLGLFLGSGGIRAAAIVSSVAYTTVFLAAWWLFRRHVGGAAPIRWRRAAANVLSAPGPAATVLIAVALGATAAVYPLPAAVAGAGVFGFAVLLRFPRLALSAGLLALCFSPEYLHASAGPLTHPELPKAIVVLVLLPYALLRGLHPRRLFPILAYVTLAVLAVGYGGVLAGLSYAQMASSLVTLGVAWFALAIRWDPVRDRWTLRVVVFIPVASVILGVLFQAAGFWQIMSTAADGGGVPRFQAASIPAQLALFATVAVCAAYAAWRLDAWRWGPLMIVVDGAILLATVSRGAVIALAVTALPAVWRHLVRPALDRAPRAVPRLVAVVGLLAVAGAVVVPSFAARNNEGVYVAGVGVEHDATSGRAAAWSEFYAIARRQPLFGHGLGSGPITKIQEQGFEAQHNEYLRLFLEGGYVGGGLVLLAIVAVIAGAVRRADRRLRPDLIALALAMALYSFTENTLTSPGFAVPFALILALTAAPSSRAPTWRPA